MSNQVKHESETSRQHVRYKIPAKLNFNEKLYPLHEWSVSGFSAEQVYLDLGTEYIHSTKMIFEIETFTLTIDIQFEILRHDIKKGELAGHFVNISKHNLSLLHYIINAFLSGEVVTMDDIIHVVGHDGFSKKDLDKELNQQLSIWEKLTHTIKKIIGYAILFSVFATLVWFVSVTLFNRLYIVESLSARINGPIVVLRAPADGFFQTSSEIKSQKLKDGDLLGIIKLISGGSVSIESPCDCQLLSKHVIENLFVARYEPVYTVIDNNMPLHIEAQIAFEDVQRVRIGDSTEILLPDGQVLNGKIIRVRSGNRMEYTTSAPLKSVLPKAYEYADVIIIIDVEKKLTPDMLDTVVSVKINTYAQGGSNSRTLY